MSSRISNKKPDGVEEFLKKKDNPALEEMRKKLLGEEDTKEARAKQAIRLDESTA